MDVHLRAKVDGGLPNSVTQNASPGLTTQVLAQKVADPRTLAPLVRAAVLDTLHVETRAHLEQTLRLDPSAVRPRVLLFMLELAEQRFAQAEPIVIALTREFPREPDYLAMHADLLLRRVDLSQSRELATKALALDPEHLDATRVKLVLDVISSEHPAHDGHLAALRDKNPNDQQVLVNLFHALVERRHFDEAKRLGQQLLHIQPNNQGVRDALLDLRIFTHPLGLPLYPLRNAGWLVSGATWLMAIAGYKAISNVSETLAVFFAATCLCFVVYSWLYPALMRRWLKAQGS